MVAEILDQVMLVAAILGVLNLLCLTWLGCVGWVLHRIEKKLERLIKEEE